MSLPDERLSPMDNVRANLADARADLDHRIGKVTGPLCEEHAAHLAAQAARIERMQEFIDKWQPRKPELDIGFSKAHPVVAEFLDDVLVLVGVKGNASD